MHDLPTPAPAEQPRQPIDGAGTTRLGLAGTANGAVKLRRLSQAEDPLWRQQTLRRIYHTYKQLAETMDSPPGMKHVAQKLNRTDRQLRRWLQDCGTTLRRVAHMTEFDEEENVR